MKKIACMLILIGLVLSTANIAASFQTDNAAKYNPDDAIVKNKSIYGKKYAVIIVGSYGFAQPNQTIKEVDENRTQYYTWFLNAAQGIYNVLKDKYNFKDENIYTFIPRIKGYPLPSGFNESILNKSYSPDKSHIEKVFKSFKEGNSNELNENDLLFVTFINHGGDGRYLLNAIFKLPNKNGINAHNTFFALEPRLNFIFKYLLKYDSTLTRLVFPNTWIFDYQFAGYLKGIKATTVVALQPCFSGGYINDLSGDNRIIMSASLENETADESWIEPFTWALNSPGSVSILQAFESANEYVVTHTDNQHPLIDDNGDKLGHSVGENGYDPNTPGQDGYLAANTYL